MAQALATLTIVVTPPANTLTIVENGAPKILTIQQAPTVEVLAVGYATPGLQGPTGPAGTSGQPRYSGPGTPPNTIIGSNPGDQYLNTLTGDIYQQV